MLSLIESKAVFALKSKEVRTITRRKITTGQGREGQEKMERKE